MSLGGARRALDWKELGRPRIGGSWEGLGSKGSLGASEEAGRASGKAGRASRKAERALGKAGRADADADEDANRKQTPVCV